MFKSVVYAMILLILFVLFVFLGTAVEYQKLDKALYICGLIGFLLSTLFAITFDSLNNLGKQLKAIEEKLQEKEGDRK